MPDIEGLLDVVQEVEAHYETSLCVIDMTPDEFEAWLAGEESVPGRCGRLVEDDD